MLIVDVSKRGGLERRLLHTDDVSTCQIRGEWVTGSEIERGLICRLIRAIDQE